MIAIIRGDLWTDEEIYERQARLDSIRDTPLTEPRPYDPDGPCGWQRREYWRAWKRIKGGKITLPGGEAVRS